jgi:hypothetical protein
MKQPVPESLKTLEELPGIGPAMAADLRLVGIQHPAQLAGKNGFELYDELCRKTGQRHDPCVIDVFLSVIHFMETGEAQNWWSFSHSRKQQIANAE